MFGGNTWWQYLVQQLGGSTWWQCLLALLGICTAWSVFNVAQLGSSAWWHLGGLLMDAPWARWVAGKPLDAARHVVILGCTLGIIPRFR